MGIDGLDKFDEKINEILRETRGKMLGQILLKAVQPVIKEAASRAPRGSGKLADSMTAQILNSGQVGEAVVRVGPGRPEGSHGVLLEFGTVKMTKRPFLALAYETTREAVTNIFEDEVRDAFGR